MFSATIKKGNSNRGKRFVFPFFIFFPLFLLSTFSLFSDQKLTAEPSSYQLGTFSAAIPQQVAFTLKNEGNEPVRIYRALTTCNCLKVIHYPKQIAPGEKAKLSAVLPAYTLSGPFSQYIMVCTDIPGPDQMLRVKAVGEAIPLFTISCDRPNVLTDSKPGTNWKGTYTIRAKLPDIRLGTPHAVEYGGTTSRYEIVSLSDSPAQYRVTRTVRLSDKPAQSSALEFPVIADKLKEPPPPVRLELEVLLSPPLTLLPDTLKIPYQVTPLTRIVNLLLPAGKKITAHSQLPTLNGIKDIDLKAVPLKSRRGWRLTLTFSALAIDRLDEKGKLNIPILQEGKTTLLHLESLNR